MCGTLRPSALELGRPRPRAGRGPSAPPSSVVESKSSCRPRQMPRIGTPGLAALGDQLVEAAARGSAPSPAGRRRRRAGSGRRRRATSSASSVIVAVDADVLQRLLDRAQVAHPVVEDRDPGRSFAQRPLGRGHAALLGVDRDGDPQGAGEGLEAGLDHVVGVGAVADRDVQGQLGAVGDGAEELLGQLGVEAGDRGRPAGRRRRRRAGGRRCRSRTRPATRPSAPAAEP